MHTRQGRHAVVLGHENAGWVHAVGPAKTQ
jgi:D-arabinose 1-dehydrogenase-like Zn-dependent alcohol dehydrogenase